MVEAYLNSLLASKVLCGSPCRSLSLLITPSAVHNGGGDGLVPTEEGSEHRGEWVFH